MGLQLDYIPQPSPDGLAQAYLLAEGWLGGAASAIILGDNIFFGQGLSQILGRASSSESGTVFGYQVREPKQYGVLGFDADGKVTSIVEKPANPASRFAVTGLYFLTVLHPSERTTLNRRSVGSLRLPAFSSPI